MVRIKRRKLMRLFVLAAGAIVCLGGSARAEVATYYGQEFAGHRTASGEKFSPGAMTAAHRTLPFGAEVDRAAFHERTTIIDSNDY
jgi:rare lipoprotein A